LAALGAMALRDNNGGGESAGATNTPIRLAGIDSYDPQGDNKEEHDDRVQDATDGDSATYWTTESYQDEFTKSGVGVVLDATREVEPKSLTVTTDTPGFTAEIQASDSPTGGFEPVSGSRTVDAETTFTLNDAQARYFVVWITDLDGVAHVNEVRAA
jgi:hypothetical protein